MPAIAERSAVNVLVVEDGDDQRFLLQRYFELAGCEVTATASAEAAMTSMGVSPPDLAVIDLILPGMNGWEFSEQIRRDWPECLVVISSVLDIGQYPSSDAQLEKPVSRADVRGVLENLVPGWAA